MNLRLIAGAAALAAALTSSFAQPRVMDVDTGKNGAPIQKTMYGIFLRTSTMVPTAAFTAKCW